MLIRGFRMPCLAVLACLFAVATASAELPSQDWTRTETRTDCANYNPLRTPLFGETHIHTSFSGDATFVRVRTTPRDAYMFAQGAQIGLPPVFAVEDLLTGDHYDWRIGSNYVRLDPAGSQTHIFRVVT